MMQKNFRNDWNPGTLVLVWEHSVRAIQCTNITGFRRFSKNIVLWTKVALIALEGLNLGNMFYRIVVYKISSNCCENRTQIEYKILANLIFFLTFLKRNDISNTSPYSVYFNCGYLTGLSNTRPTQVVRRGKLDQRSDSPYRLSCCRANLIRITLFNLDIGTIKKFSIF